MIAEVGNNHQGSVETAKEIFDRAKDAGANAVKLQKRDNKVVDVAAAFGRGDVDYLT